LSPAAGDSAWGAERSCSPAAVPGPLALNRPFVLGLGTAERVVQETGPERREERESTYPAMRHGAAGKLALPRTAVAVSSAELR